jgi:hypothetical protein
MLSTYSGISREQGFKVLRWILWAAATLLLILLPNAASAGTIKLAWDPVGDTDLAGYKVYYGTSSGVYTGSTSVGNQTSADVINLQDCKVYYLAVKAVDANGNESPAFSNEISGMSAPEPATVTPNNTKQATTNQQVTIGGTNFDTQARPDFGPDIIVNSYSTTSCNQMTANITITDAALVNEMPDANGKLVLTTPRLLRIINNGGPQGSKSGPFSVTFNERRADIDGSGKVGGRDLLYWHNAFGSVVGNPNYDASCDLNGDGMVDGTDLGLLAAWHGHIFF